MFKSGDVLFEHGFKLENTMKTSSYHHICNVPAPRCYQYHDVSFESMFTKYWLTALSSFPRKKCGYVNWPSRHDHSCWLGRNESSQPTMLALKLY